MASKHLLFIFFIISSSQIHSCSSAETWIRAGYWYAGSLSPIPDINSALFTHLIYGFANVSSSSYKLIFPSADQEYYSSFTEIVKRRNPSIITHLSIWNGRASTVQGILGERVNSSVFSSMVSHASTRRSFIESSITTARRYGFNGINLLWLWPNSASDMINIGKLLDEWRAAVDSEPRNSSQTRLILTMTVKYVPSFNSMTYPIESMKKNLDWAHVLSYDYHLPEKENVTGAHAALYDPTSNVSTDYGIRQWLNTSFPASKLVMGLPYHGYAWTLVDAKDNNNGIGAPASGVSVTPDGSMSYDYIKKYTQSYRVKIIYNASYVVNYCVIGSSWIGFDDVEAIRVKIGYAKEKKLLGYHVFQVLHDYNWALSRAAMEEVSADNKKPRLLLIILLLPVTIIAIFIAFEVCCLKRESLKTKGRHFILMSRQPESVLDSGSSNLQVFSFSSIKAATNKFSSENKLGEGGFGAVYKGKLRNGKEIAVKRLSKTSTQGLQEFRNEVLLTARLEHVNLVKVLGFCTQKEEKMLIYEYMPNKSLDLYLFDPSTKQFLDWKKRVHIIEGVTQGLLYLQEYSNMTIIHRDLKASNILLDHDMNAKISDFGMAKLFRKDALQGNTGRIVGTYGCVPPEYVRKGIYSMKYDVYSFGVLLLQVISGKRNTSFYGPDNSQHLLEYAYASWLEDKGKDFIDPMLDDSSCSCKLLTCLQVALLCVQEKADDRPTMLEVHSMLKSDNVATVPIPTKMAFSGKEYGHVPSPITPASQQASSVNDAGISELLPR